MGREEAEHMVRILSELPIEMVVTDPADCPGLNDWHVFAQFEARGIRAELDGPLDVVGEMVIVAFNLT